MRDFGVFGEGAREGQIDDGVLIAPKGGDDWGDDHGDLAVGETEESGGAALEDVGVRALRFPRESVKGRKSGDAAGGSGKNPGEKAEGFGEGFCAAIRIGDEESGAAEFVREIGGDERLGDIVETGEGNVLCAGAQGGERAFHGGMAKNSLQSFANGGEDHGRVSGIRARGGSALANFLKNLRGGVARHHGNGHNAATGGFDLFAANDLIAGPVSALYDDIGQKFGDDFARGEVVENNDGVDAFEGGEDFGALAFWEHRTAFAFEMTNAGVTVQADDKGIAQLAGLFQALNMAGMEEIEAAVGEDEALAVAFLAGKPHNRLLQSEDVWFQGISMQARTERVHMMSVEQTVYHAREAARAREGASQMRAASCLRMGCGTSPAAGPTEVAG